MPRTGRFPATIVCVLAALGAAQPQAQAQSMPTIRVTGEMQTVFRWATDRCATDDFPDSPARAFRGADGRLRLIASHMNARVMTGPDLDRMRHDCRVVHAGARNDSPAAHNDRAWILSPYTLDGNTIYALIHNEYQGHLRPAECPSRAYIRCWYNTITWAVSRDGGATFTRPAPPNDLVMSVPYRYAGDTGNRVGYFNPSNVVAHEGHFYALVLTFRFREQEFGVCLIRTDRLDDPKSWRGWDRRGFNVRFVDPYREAVDDPRAHVCAPVGRGNLVEAVSLVRHQASGLWIAVMAATRPAGAERTPTQGIHASASRDLINWSETVPVFAAQIFRPRACDASTTFTVAYPALIDARSAARNLDTFGAQGWLYMTRFNVRECQVGSNRDLVRVPIAIE
jgi:hypothetical protein